MPPTAAATFKVSPTALRSSRQGGQALLGTINVELKGERGTRFRAICGTSANCPTVATLDFDRASGGRIAVVDGDETKALTQFEGVLFLGQTRSFELAWDSPPLFGDLEAVASWA